MNHEILRPRILRSALSLVALGAVCSLTSPAYGRWNEQVIDSFRGGTDGSVPTGGVVFDKAGNLYGTTIQEGSTECLPGVVRDSL
jgi:hypothetical protein